MIVSEIRAYTRAPTGNAIAAVLSLGNPGQTPWRALHQSRATRRNTRYLFLIKLMKSLIIHDLNFKRRSTADLFIARRIRGHTRIKKTSFSLTGHRVDIIKPIRNPNHANQKLSLLALLAISTFILFVKARACHSSIAVQESWDGRPILFSRVKWIDYAEIHK